jgi:uncharacterized protein
MEIVRRKIVVAALIAALAAPLASYAAETDSRPSEQSLKELLELTQTRSIFDNVLSQANDSVVAAISRATQGQTLTDEQKKILSESRTRALALVQQQLNWDALEPRVIDAYRDTFTQQEIDGMLKFYRSPSGKAVVSKMPQIMEKMSQQVQGEIQALAPKLVQLQRDTAARLKSAPNSAAGNSSGSAETTPPKQ